MALPIDEKLDRSRGRAVRRHHMMPAGRDRLRNQRGFLAIGDGAVADLIPLAQENHMILAASNSRYATNSRA